MMDKNIRLFQAITDIDDAIIEEAQRNKTSQKNSKVFYTGHLIPLREKPAVFWRALRSDYLKYIGLKSALVFWLK